MWFAVVRFLVRECPGQLCLVVGLVWLAPHTSLIGLFAVLTVGGVRCWAVCRPASFSRVTGPLRALWWRHRVRAEWPELMESCRLAPGESPRICRIRSSWPHIRVVVRPVAGQTMTTFENAAEPLRMALGANRVRVEPHRTRDVLLTLTVGDELRVPFTAPIHEASTSLDTVPLGRTERGDTWRLAVGPHTLVAGCSGSGKGSVFWSFVFALAPAVREGRVQLHGIDLKGGMEILMGDELFTTTATDEPSAVISLERLVGLMRERNKEYAGRLRSHHPTPEHPLHVVMVDELAALTAYCTDRDLQRRAEKAINLLCSQGRAPGFVVFACLQDPRKEVIPSRGLFTQMVGLRLKDMSETSMVLGDAALQSGAFCHRITRDLPGTGYVVPEDGSPPMRVRAGYAPDSLIREVATRFATPTRLELDVPPPDDASWQRSGRRRNTGAVS